MNAPGQRDTPFAFSAESLRAVKRQIAKYPKGRQQSAVLAVLDLAQRQCGGWLPQTAIEAVAETLEMPKIRVLEVATFYSMFNLTPVGRYVVQICTTTPCALRGSAGIAEAFQQHLKIPFGGTTADGMFTLREVECLGACVNAPMMQVGRKLLRRSDTRKRGVHFGSICPRRRARSWIAVGPSNLGARRWADDPR